MFLDNWLFDKVFEKFAHWFQMLTGKNNFFLARIFLFLDWILKSYFCIELHVYFILVVHGVLFYVGVATIRTLEKIMTQNSGERYMNPFRIKENSRFIRLLLFWMCLVILSVIPLGNIMWKLMMVFFETPFYVVYIYFLGCTPLPPQKSKLAQWLKSAKQKLSKAVSPPEVTPEPEAVPG